MYVLGIESATPVASVAVVNEGVLLAERLVNNRHTHSEKLLPMIKGVLEDAGVKPSQLEGIAVSAGPGSFTGLRIGMSTAKTLAQVWRLPIAGVSTLQALAYPLTNLKELICPVLNARKKEVYAAIYDSCNGTLTCLFGPVAINLEELAQQLEQLNRPFALLGDAAPVYRDFFRERFADYIYFVPEEISLPRAAAIAGIGWRELQAGRGVDPLLLTPYYIRPSEAEAKWLQKKEIRN